jgi:hypothetical protein
LMDHQRSLNYNHCKLRYILIDYSTMMNCMKFNILYIKLSIYKFKDISINLLPFLKFSQIYLKSYCQAVVELERK